METRFRLMVMCIFLLTATMVPANVNAKTHKVLYLYAESNDYGNYFASFGIVDYKYIKAVEDLPDITGWLMFNEYDLVIIEDAAIYVSGGWGFASYDKVYVETIGSITTYVEDTGKSLLILFDSGRNCYGEEYLSGFGAVPVRQPHRPDEAVTSFVVDHEVTTGVWGIYVYDPCTLSIHKGFITPLAYAPYEWWGISDSVVAGAIEAYGNGKVAYASADDLISNSEKADNNRLMINVVNWLFEESIGPEELPVELKNLQEEIKRLTTEINGLTAEIDRLNAEKKSLEEEIAQLQQQKEEVINNLPLVKGLKQQIDDLNSKYNGLKSDYNSLQTSYNDLKLKYDDLKSKHEGAIAPVLSGISPELVYVFIATTLIFIATTIYFARKKPKI